MIGRILAVRVQVEQDIVFARQRAREIAALLGFEPQEQTGIATAVSEIVRNAYQYAGGGTVEFSVEGHTQPQVLQIGVVDNGPGIPNILAVLQGRYKSETGMGLGIQGARRLMDQLFVEPAARGGTVVRMRKFLPRRAPLMTIESARALADKLARQRRVEAMDELRQQSQELVRALTSLRERNDELTRLNQELEDTNRGVVALYAELDEKAEQLRKADEIKSKFLSHMGHEFRTPLNSILALSRILLDRLDGDLTPEQARQVGFIQKAASDLTELVNDLLDIARVEAGKTVVRLSGVETAKLFGALRGMMRPLVQDSRVVLIFEEPQEVPAICTDEAKLSQILRNLISNAIKFTERGEIRVSARTEGSNVLFSVADTGIGIAPADQERIFHEFGQIDSHIQRRVKGTGLGLPLSRRLAELLNGTISVESQLGSGSVFTVRLPLDYTEAAVSAPGVPVEVEPAEPPILIVTSEDAKSRWTALLSHSAFRVLFAHSVRDAEHLRAGGPLQAVVIDLAAGGEAAWAALAALGRFRTAIPILASARDDQRPRIDAAAVSEVISPPESPVPLLSAIRAAVTKPELPRVLVIDDDDLARYVIRKHLEGEPLAIIETTNGRDGLDIARRERPDIIVLDLVMPEVSGFQVLEQLGRDAATRDIPVIVHTSKTSYSEEQERIARRARTVLTKSNLEGNDLRTAVRLALASRETI
ncbi:MAG TPA: ATP-binding protein [Bryobacteraceae bacterium]|nr:ATP-binding protein [Bryobacteraceae bacterium]